jgi:hypothetical protein
MTSGVVMAVVVAVAAAGLAGTRRDPAGCPPRQQRIPLSGLAGCPADTLGNQPPPAGPGKRRTLRRLNPQVEFYRMA